ncbi:glycosyltransferase family 2 protein [Roseiflexus castenholzii]|uniref:glycosyltransferase family 2 protein n=1 Tax=Roseiflexus castenholzii TaxID=120962 RepID=UPI0000E76A42|nr:glycosyltransferase family 2 protein [Roseiflexus castenholzii]
MTIGHFAVQGTELTKDDDGLRPLLSTVIVNSDGCADTLRCMESLCAHPPDLAALAPRAGALPEHEIILVDNRSRDGCVTLVRERFPAVRILESPARQGFSKNYNLGIRHANGVFVLALNNDTLVHPGALTTLLNAILDTPAYGMVGPRLIGRDGWVQAVCARPVLTPLEYLLTQSIADPGFPIGRLWLLSQQISVARRRSGSVPCISGACMLVRRTAFEQAGLFDEAVDFYYEDIEWCHRMACHGWQVGYVAEATITHLGDQSIRNVKVWAKKSEYFSALRYFRRYHGLTDEGARVLRAATSFGWLMRGIAFVLAEGLFGLKGHARAYLYLWHWILRDPSARPDRVESQ